METIKFRPFVTLCILTILCFVKVIAEAQVPNNFNSLSSWIPPKNQCQKISIPMCQDLGYNLTLMPNLMGHSTQDEAEKAMREYMSLVTTHCSPHIRFFLCSAFAPLCSEHVAGAVGGCRELCVRVAEPCRAELQRLGLPSAPLDCARYPDRAAARLCMRPPDVNTTRAQLSAIPPPLVPLAAPCPPGFARVLSGRGECVALCSQPEEKRLASAWLLGAATASLLSTSFALLTFCAEPTRFRYPQRPVVYVAACHGLVALAHAARAWLGPRAAACSPPSFAYDDAQNASCTLIFLVTYFFGLAADAWFLNLCAAWYLAAANEWSTEALERVSARFHAGAWGWAGVWTCVAVALRRVAADEVATACPAADGSSAALAGVPRGAALLAAAALGAAAACAVRRVRRALEGRGAARLERFAARLATLSLLYWLASSTGAAASLYAAYAQASWRARALAAALECAGGSDAACATDARSAEVVVSLLRAVLPQCAGVAAGAWAWSRKSCRAWARTCGGAPRKAPACCRPAAGSFCYAKRPLRVMNVAHV